MDYQHFPNLNPKTDCSRVCSYLADGTIARDYTLPFNCISPDSALLCGWSLWSSNVSRAWG
jgi:hypothetical protein